MGFYECNNDIRIIFSYKVGDKLKGTKRQRGEGAKTTERTKKKQERNESTRWLILCLLMPFLSAHFSSERSCCCCWFRRWFFASRSFLPFSARCWDAAWVDRVDSVFSLLVFCFNEAIIYARRFRNVYLLLGTFSLWTRAPGLGTCCAECIHSDGFSMIVSLFGRFSRQLGSYHNS